MSYPYRHIIIVSDADRAAGNQAAAGIDPDVGGALTFAVPLSPTGAEPATHWGCSSLTTEAMRQAMEGAEVVLPSVCWWRLDAATGLLLATSTEHGVMGEEWTWADALAAMGLQVVQSDVEV